MLINIFTTIKKSVKALIDSVSKYPIYTFLNALAIILRNPDRA